MNKHSVFMLFMLFLLLPFQTIAATETGVFNTSIDTAEVELLADKWNSKPEDFYNSVAYKPFISDNVLIHGMGSSPNFRYGKTLTYYNYSNPTIFFLPQNHSGGTLSLYVFFHGDRIVPEINIKLDDKSYTLKPQRATDEYIYNSYLQKRPVWNSGLALTLVVPPGKRYVQLKADNNELLLAKVSFIEPRSSEGSSTQKVATIPETNELPKEPVKPANQGAIVLITPSKPQTNSAWITYTSTTKEFSLTYPKDWTLNTNVGSSLLELTPPKGSKKVALTKDSLGGNTLTQFASQMGKLVGMREVSTKFQGGADRLKQTAQVTLGDMSFYLEVLYVKAGSYVYTITCMAPEVSKDDYVIEIDKILSSFNVL